jgi:hypothetical protein
MMTLRDAITYLLGVGTFLVAASSCAAPPVVAGAGGGGLLRDRGAGYEMEVLVDGAPAATFSHDGETYTLGQLGARYTVRVSNHTGRRIEAVVSVDGRDVIDGKPAELRGKRGYLVPAYGQVDIDGWRISQSEAAAFRFSSVPESYAARTGSAREVGVIGVAIFPERYVPPPPPAHVHAYPEYRRPFYDGAPSAGRDSAGEGGGGLGNSGGRAASAPAKRGASDDRMDGLAESESAPRAESSRSAAPQASAAAPPAAEEKKARRRSGLGTEYGEAVSSPIYEVEFVRANPGHPATVLGLRYNDRQGLLALGIDVDGPEWAASDHEEELRRTAEPFPASHRRFAAPPPGWREGCCVR